MVLFYRRYHNNLWTIRPNITYNHKKFQFILGPVISKILSYNNYRSGINSIKVITGINTGVKYYSKKAKKNRLYYSIENIYLNYHSNEKLEVNSYSSEIEAIGDSNWNKVVIVQPVFSTGYEFLWFNTLSFSFDFGFGWSLRKYKYPNYYSSYYPTKVSNIIGQLKFSLGYIF